MSKENVVDTEIIEESEVKENDNSEITKEEKAQEEERKRIEALSIIDNFFNWKHSYFMDKFINLLDKEILTKNNVRTELVKSLEKSLVAINDIKKEQLKSDSKEELESIKKVRESFRNFYEEMLKEVELIIKPLTQNEDLYDNEEDLKKEINEAFNLCSNSAILYINPNKNRLFAFGNNDTSFNKVFFISIYNMLSSIKTFTINVELGYKSIIEVLSENETDIINKLNNTIEECFKFRKNVSNECSEMYKELSSKINELNGKVNFELIRRITFFVNGMSYHPINIKRNATTGVFSPAFINTENDIIELQSDDVANSYLNIRLDTLLGIDNLSQFIIENKKFDNITVFIPTSSYVLI